ncbi:MAG TPA: hypothetical protein VFN85_09080 [Solirubrobacterales bacterium]|nr:hypothetical protein [Solirubrobacterales bacterium]
MRPGRVRAFAVVAFVGAALVAGCGESRHANEPRPQVSTRISVTINPEQLIVQPTEIGTKAEPNQEVEQNQGNPAPPIKTKAPLDVTVVAANQTAKDTKLKITGAKNGESDTIYAHSPGTFGVTLPAGSYTIKAVGMPGSQPGHLTVGSYRESSQNDLLLP